MGPSEGQHRDLPTVLPGPKTPKLCCHMEAQPGPPLNGTSDNGVLWEGGCSGREGPRGGVAAGPGMCWGEGTRPPPSTAWITSNRGPAGDGEGGSRLWSEGALGDCLPRTVRGSGHRRRPVREGEGTGLDTASPLPLPHGLAGSGRPVYRHRHLLAADVERDERRCPKRAGREAEGQ